MITQDQLVELKNKVSGLDAEKTAADSAIAASENADAAAVKAAADAAASTAAKVDAVAKVAARVADLKTFVDAMAAV